LDTTDGGSRDNKLESGVVNSGEIASSRWLVLLRAKCEREDVDTSVWVARVVLEWLNQVEVGTFTLREAILSVQLKFGGDNWIFTPAVHVECSLGEDEDTGVRDTFLVFCSGSNSTLLEKTTCTISGVSTNYSIRGGDNARCGVLILQTGSESKDGVRESINGISVVKWLSTKGSVKSSATDERITVCDMKIRLDNPDKFFAWVIEIQLNFVGRRTD
tara:strand:+ start:158 stop:808 length:651 start_codon:yes stop_codon:yes gene_type:complete